MLDLHFAKHPGLEEKIGHLYRAHLAACERIGAPTDGFERFALEIVNAPAEAQAEMLNPLPPESYEPAMRYRQYDSPTDRDWKLSW
jgi:hypothetical protein